MKAKNVMDQRNEAWNFWTLMWNGDLEMADKIIEDGFFPKLLMDPPFEINNAEKMKEWVVLVRSKFESIKYETLAGPFIDEKLSTLSCHWKATGVFSGKTDFPTD